jgi:CxxC motif-containing protein (DUF1111 family)
MRTNASWMGWCVLISAACAEQGPPIETDEQPAIAIGGALPGTDPDAFAEGLEAFAEIEFIEDGLGPIFNEAACGSCHTTPVVGGSGDQIERRFGRNSDGVFFGYDDAFDNHGGTLRQLFTNGTYVNGDVTCTIPLEIEPANANIKMVGRRTTPLFGLGLVDAMPDAWFDALAAAQPASIRGTARRVPVLLPDPRDPTQTLGAQRVARFGWKAGVPSLVQFSGDAYLNEMGITTQSCFEGASVLAFARENLPNNIAPPPGCNGGDLAAPNPPGDPDLPEFTDDAVGPCGDALTEIQDDLILFTTFMENLAPPPRAIGNPLDFLAGAVVFAQAKCAGCHVPVPFVTPAAPFNGVPGDYTFFPFSDFLIHDMGGLGDLLGDTGDSIELTRKMRTAPLWGARFNTSFLHDGRAPTVQAAIEAHDGQAAAARDAFNALSSARKARLVRFVRAL